MKKVLKNILFVSYLKNKGVRRICFVLGVLFGVICFLDWHYEFKRTNYKLFYQSLEQAVQDNKYNRDVLESIYKNYPVKFNFGASFYEWNDFFTGYGGKYNTIISLCRKRHKREENTTSKPWEEYGQQQGVALKPWEEYQSSYQKKQNGEEKKYPPIAIEVCNKLESYISQPVKIESVNWNKLYDIKWVVFWFYFPFLFCLPFKWIYRGFKEKA